MPLFKSQEQRAAEGEEQAAAARARGVFVLVTQAQHVPHFVEKYCNEGWRFDSVTYAGPGFRSTGTPYGMQTIVFRWPGLR